MTVEPALFAASPLGAFRSWRTPDGRCPQGEFLSAAASSKIRIFRSGNRVGKTTIGAVDTLLHLLGWHPCGRGKAPPQRWWVSALSWEVVSEVLWPAIEPLLPPRQIARIAWLRRGAPALPLAVTFKNGSELRFKSADQGRPKYQGAELDGVWLDEEHPEEVVEECRARLIRRRGYLTVTLTPILRLRWVQQLEAEDGARVFRASMHEAAEGGLLPLEEVERYAASLPDRQRRVRVFGDFSALEGAVYPELQRATHGATPRGAQLMVGGDVIALWPLPSTWPRWAAIDWGYANPTAVIVAAHDTLNDRLIVERCYYASGIRASTWAQLLAERLPSLRAPLISDHDANARAEAEAEGLATTPAQKEIDLGLEAVERLLTQRSADGHPRLVFALSGVVDPVLGQCDAEKLLWEGELYHYPTARPGRPDPIDRPVKRDDHALDALRYLVIGWEGARGGPPAPPTRTKATKSRELEGYAPRWEMSI